MKEIFSAIGNSVLGTMFNGASKLISNFKADPTKVEELANGLAQLQITATEELARIQNQAEEIQAKELETVNATMREEGKSEHWAQWIWRPMIGFTFCLMIINNYVLFPYFAKYGMVKIEIPDRVYEAMLVILGAASAGRGFTKWQDSKNEQPAK